ARLLSALKKGMPLPLNSIQNKRSLLGLPNLASAVDACINNDIAFGQTYLLADDYDLSTPELIRLLASAYDLTPKLCRCPVLLLKLIGKISGRSNEINRLIHSLQVDVHKIKDELMWRPIVKPEDIFKMNS